LIGNLQKAKVERIYFRAAREHGAARTLRLMQPENANGSNALPSACQRPLPTENLDTETSMRSKLVIIGKL